MMVVDPMSAVNQRKTGGRSRCELPAGLRREGPVPISLPGGVLKLVLDVRATHRAMRLAR
jgi:hypothetical protein